MMIGLMAVATVPGVARQGKVVDDDWCRQDRSNNGDREQACEVREFTVPVGAGQLAVDAAPNGGIQVTGATRGDIVVRAKVTARRSRCSGHRPSSRRCGSTSPRTRFRRTGRRDSGSARAGRSATGWRCRRVMSLQLKTVNGGISIQGVDGRLEFTTVNGGVKLSGVSGDVHGRTSNGGVDVDLDGATWQGEGLDVETSNGGVRLRIPEQYSARLDAGTVNGGINVDFPITMQGRIDREIATNLGAGGPTIRVRTHNGGVKVTKK